MDFEKKLLHLEEINKKLSQEISIEEGIALFEKSVAITKECVEYLNAAKLKIEQIKNEAQELIDLD